MTSHARERTIRGLHEQLFLNLPLVDKQSGVLDLGCGTGAWLQRLACAGFTNLHGIDLNLAQFQATAGCTQANLDSDDLGLDGRTFGLVTAIEVVEHLECPARLFLHVSRHLAPNGAFLMSTPNLHSLLVRLRFLITGRLQHFDDYGDPTHISPVYLPCLKRTLAHYGLRIRRLWTHPPAEGGLNSKRTSHLAAMLARVLLNDPMPGDVLCLHIEAGTRN